MPTLTRNRIWAARSIAVCADLLQIGLFPFFSGGFISPLTDALDIAVCIALTVLVGWHFAFLPSLLVEMMPIVDLAPTWTIAVLVATRHRPDATAESPQGSQSTVTVDEDAPSAPPGAQVVPKLLSQGARENGTK